MKREADYRSEELLLTQISGQVPLACPQKLGWKMCHLNCTRTLAFSSQFPYFYISSFTLIQKVPLLHAFPQEEPSNWGPWNTGKRGNLWEKATLHPPWSSQRRSFLTWQTWNLNEAPLLRAQAVSGGCSIPSERDYSGIKTKQNPKVHILMKFTWWWWWGTKSKQ